MIYEISERNNNIYHDTKSIYKSLSATTTTKPVNVSKKIRKKKIF